MIIEFNKTENIFDLLIITGAKYATFSKLLEASSNNPKASKTKC